MSKYYLLLLLFSASTAVVAQGSELFPDTLRQALRKEITFERPPPPEPEVEPDTVAAWDVTPYRRPLLIGAAVMISAGLAFLLYRVYRDLQVSNATAAGGSSKPAPVDIGTYPEQVLVQTGVSPELLAQAEAGGQYTVAVRLAYLGLLHDLGRAGLLRYQSDFSNADYLRQLESVELRDAFREIVHHYERYWYGNHPLDRLSYRVVRQSITTMQQQMSINA